MYMYGRESGIFPPNPPSEVIPYSSITNHTMCTHIALNKFLYETLVFHTLQVWIREATH